MINLPKPDMGLLDPAIAAEPGTVVRERGGG